MSFGQKGVIFAVAEFGSQEYKDSVQLRRRLLRLPLGLDFTDNELEAEQDQLHLIAQTGGGYVFGIALLERIDAQTAKMRQVAIDPDFQGRGLGRELVDYFESVARKEGYRRIALNARDTAVDFYLRLGYATEGEPFEEVTVRHWRMVKEL